MSKSEAEVRAFNSIRYAAGGGGCTKFPQSSYDIRLHSQDRRFCLCMGLLRSTVRRCAITAREPRSAYWAPLGDFERSAGRRHTLHEPLAGPDAELRRIRNHEHIARMRQQYEIEDPAFSLWSRIRKGESKPESSSLHEILTSFSSQPFRALHVHAIEQHLASTNALDEHALRLCINAYYRSGAARLLRGVLNRFLDKGGTVSDPTLALFLSRMFALGYAVDCRDCYQWALRDPSASGSLDGGAAVCTAGPLSAAAVVRAYAELRDSNAAVGAARIALAHAASLPEGIFENVLADVLRAYGAASTPPEAEQFWESVESLITEVGNAADAASGVKGGGEEGVRLGANFRTPATLAAAIDGLAEGLLTPMRRARFRRRVTDPLWDGALVRAGHALSAVVPIDPSLCWGGDVDSGPAGGGVDEDGRVEGVRHGQGVSEGVARWRSDDIYTALLRLAAVVNTSDVDGVVEARLLGVGPQARKPSAMYEPLLTAAAVHRDDATARGSPLKKTDKLDQLLADMEVEGVALSDAHHTAIIRGFGQSGRHWHVDNYALRNFDHIWHSWHPSDQGKNALVRELVYAYGATRQLFALRQLRQWHLPSPFFGSRTSYRYFADIYSWGTPGKWSNHQYGTTNFSLPYDFEAPFPAEYMKQRPKIYGGGGEVKAGENVNPRIPRPATESWSGEVAEGDALACAGMGEGAKVATLEDGGLAGGNGMVWCEYIHALLNADDPSPMELSEYFARDHPRSHRFYWGLRWIKFDNRRKWRVYDGPNATWQMAMQMAHSDGITWWDL